MGWNRGPIQLICRGRLSMPTLQVLVVSSTNLKKKLAKTTVLVDNNNKENKDSYSSFSSGWPRSHSS